MGVAYMAERSRVSNKVPSTPARASSTASLRTLNESSSTASLVRRSASRAEDARDPGGKLRQRSGGS